MKQRDDPSPPAAPSCWKARFNYPAGSWEVEEEEEVEEVEEEEEVAFDARSPRLDWESIEVACNDLVSLKDADRRHH